MGPCGGPCGSFNIWEPLNCGALWGGGTCGSFNIWEPLNGGALWGDLWKLQHVGAPKRWGPVGGPVEASTCGSP